MVRYIDADSLLEQISKKKCEVGKIMYLDGFNDGLMRVRSVISAAPTADVVPKSEVERLKEQIEGLQSRNNFLEIEYKNQGNLFWARVNGVKSEVAREIFEEIDILGTYNPTLYAELKKKYTEEKK